MLFSLTNYLTDPINKLDVGSNLGSFLISGILIGVFYLVILLSILKPIGFFLSEFSEKKNKEEPETEITILDTKVVG